MLVHRDGRWLLTVRRPDARYAAGRIGLVGGHVEPGDGDGTLEATGRREVAEETGVDLTGVPLTYLASEQRAGDQGRVSIDVTFVAEAPPGAEPELRAPEELTAVGWWTPAEVADDPRCPPWVPRLLQRAGDRLAGDPAAGRSVEDA